MEEIGEPRGNPHSHGENIQRNAEFLLDTLSSGSNPGPWRYDMGTLPTAPLHTAYTWYSLTVPVETILIKPWRSLPNVISDLIRFERGSEGNPSNSVLHYYVKTNDRAVQPASLDIKVTAASHPIINAFHRSLRGDTYKTRRYEALTSWLQPETLIKQPAAAEFTGKLYEREFFICCELLPMLSWANSLKSRWFLEVRNGRGREIIDNNASLTGLPQLIKVRKLWQESHIKGGNCSV